VRQFVIGAQYRSEVEGAVVRVVELCRLDAWRREHDEAPLLQNWMLNDAKEGEEITILVDVPPALLSPKGS
jgi:hypothetical protein